MHPGDLEPTTSPSTPILWEEEVPLELLLTKPYVMEELQEQVPILRKCQVIPNQGAECVIEFSSIVLSDFFSITKL